MAGIKLSYCQLIKIILSQIGGNPLQQVYSQLSQGAQQITTRTGILPAGLQEIKTLIDTVTATINAAQQAVSDFDDTMERIAGEFYQNPLGTVLNETTAVIDAKITTAQTRIDGIDAPVSPITTPRTGFATIAEDRADLVAEVAALNSTRSTLQTYKTNTDRLVGISPQSGSAIAGGCSLQDLLGSACAPNDDVPDIDLKALIDSLKNGDAIAAIKEKLLDSVGYGDYVTALATFKSTIDTLNTNYLQHVNKAAIRSAVQSQITQMVFNLLTGCGNSVYDLTLKSNVKAKVAVYAAAIQAQNESGNAYYDGYGNTVVVSDTTVSPSLNNISVTLT